ncbi:hypothetical protein BDZ90DRAFT_280731 [Jaminaea rosea]|uniref:Amidohydrolase 3 domain-containing protein n=1 Tax=Jaminaea rosea TaxID=1569628 RepID=A0A316ULN5_9BASI|nr:hypothetical protein BDZ90DRAFT_280731 [Jaminaea rosea]PWN26196.1 hypothetical protein BDZ90DRAFT_280731 [Jaminaea rosea]
MSGKPRRRTTATRRDGAIASENDEPASLPISSGRPNAPGLPVSERFILIARVIVFSIITTGFLLHHYKPWRGLFNTSVRRHSFQDDKTLEALLQPLDNDEYAICSAGTWPLPDTAASTSSSSSSSSSNLFPFAFRRKTAKSSSIYTLQGGSPDSPSAVECILVRSHGVLAVGSASTIVSPWCASGSACDVRVLPAGYTLLPSFTDAHGHLLDLGHSLSSADLSGATSLAEVVQRLEGYILARPWLAEDTATWIWAHGWDQTRWNDTEGDAFPSKEDLTAKSEILRGRRIVAKRIDFHALWLSEAGIEDIAASSPTGQIPSDVSGGLIVRSPTGEPTGILIDNAMQLALDVIPPRTDKDRQRYLSAAQDLLLSYGVTAVGDAAASLEDLAFYRRVSDESKLGVRIYAFVSCPPRQPFCDEEARQVLGAETVPYHDGHGGNLVVRTVKLFADGALGSWGSALWEPYADRPDDRGLLLLNETDLRHSVQHWHEKGWQVAVHAIGDRANSLVLDAFESAGGNDLPSRRHRIEHAQLVRRQDQSRFARLGVVASMQPTHCTSDMGYVAARLGEERTRERAYPWRSILHGDTGSEEERAHLVLGSDFPVEGVDPISGIWSATQRLDYATLASPHGAEKPWHGQERITPLEALRGFTTEAAYAQFEEGKAGVLQTGARADFVVMRGDILEDLTLEKVKVRRQAGQREDRPVVVGTAVSDGSIPQYRNGKVTAFSNHALVPTQITSDPLYYVKPGDGACGLYTNQDAGVCMNRGWVKSGYVNSCDGKWVEITLPATGVKTVARVLDVCGDPSAPGDTFGCDDLRMTLSTFSALAQGDPAIIKANSLPTPAIWRFVQEPCWACEAGLKGISPTGKPDDCHGPDSFGIMRNGRKTGKSVRKGHAAAVHCASVVDPGHKFDEKLFVEAEVEKVSKEKGLAIEAVHEMIKQFDGHGH